MFVIMNSAVYSKNGKDRKIFKVQILAKGAVFFSYLHREHSGDRHSLTLSI